MKNRMRKMIKARQAGFRTDLAAARHKQACLAKVRLAIRRATEAHAGDDIVTNEFIERIKDEIVVELKDVAPDGILAIESEHDRIRVLVTLGDGCVVGGDIKRVYKRPPSALEQFLRALEFENDKD